MAFPQTPLGILVELLINGVWTDVSGDVRSQGGTDAITIQRGITSSGGMLADRGTCSLTLDNNSGSYGSRNPLSPYFGYLGRNTRLRVTAAYGTPWLGVLEGGNQRATTPDAAVLDVTGDIDVRADIEAAVWGDYRGGIDNFDAPSYTEICGKWVNPGQGSWVLLLSDTGQLVVVWSTTGGNFFFAASTAAIVLPPFTRQSIRFTLDVDNGAGGYTATFYTSGTAGTSGPWTQLGSALVGGSTTSIFNSTAPLEVGDLSTMGYQSLAKKIYAVEVRSGIGGTIVANPNFEAQTVGATSFSDTAPSPRTWTAASDVITNRFRRFTGEVSSWPPQWDTGGKDVTTPIVAAGALQRLGQRKAPLQSTLRRRVGAAAGMLAYWPMEDGAGATQAASPIAGVGPMRATGLTWASDSSLAGSAPLPQLSPPSTILGLVPVSSLGDWHVEFVYKLDSLPASPTLMFQVNVSGGTAATIQFLVGVGVARVQALDSNGSVIATFDSTPNNFTDGWGRVQILTSTSGGTVTVTAWWLVIGAPTNWNVFTTYSGTPGRVASVSGSWGSGFADLRIGHVGVMPQSVATAGNPYDSADKGFDGETAAARLARVASEQGISMSVAAHTTDTELVGAQTQDTILSVLQAATQADEGLLHEAREFIGLRYRGRRSLENQSSALDLPYVASPQALIAPLLPVDDDQSTVNDSTVQRTNGSSSRVTVTTGALSTQDPPNGVGLYDENVSLDLHSDDQTYYHAGWRTHLGTWDEARFPQVNIELAKNPSLIPAASRIDTGSRIRITSPLPSWLPPDAIDELVLGYTETIAQYSWRLSFACTPYGPYRTGVMDDTTLGRLDTDGSTLALAATSSATSLAVETTGGPAMPYWTTSGAEYPLALRLGGEVVTASACANGIIDSFTRTTSSGWGTATGGQAWSTSGGSASDYSTNGTAGLHSLASVNVARNTVLGSSFTNFDVEASLSTSALAAGASQFVSLIGRWIDANNLMLARLEFTTAQAVILSIRKRVAGTETQLSTVTTTLTHAASTLFRVRFAGFGSSFQARVWLASGTEPGGWQTTATDSSVTAAGPVGVRSMLNTGNTNTLPVTATCDDFALLNPQVFTVTRGTNGISKAQTVGTAVALDQPLYLAL